MSTLEGLDVDLELIFMEDTDVPPPCESRVHATHWSHGDGAAEFLVGFSCGCVKQLCARYVQHATRDGGSICTECQEDVLLTAVIPLH